MLNADFFLKCILLLGIVHLSAVGCEECCFTVISIVVNFIKK